MYYIVCFSWFIRTDRNTENMYVPLLHSLPPSLKHQHLEELCLSIMPAQLQGLVAYVWPSTLYLLVFPLNYHLYCLLPKCLICKNFFFFFSTCQSLPVHPYCSLWRTALSPMSFTMNSASSPLWKFLLNPCRKKTQSKHHFMRIWKMIGPSKRRKGDGRSGCVTDCIVIIHIRMRVGQKMQWKNIFCNNFLQHTFILTFRFRLSFLYWQPFFAKGLKKLFTKLFTFILIKTGKGLVSILTNIWVNNYYQHHNYRHFVKKTF